MGNRLRSRSGTGVGGGTPKHEAVNQEPRAHLPGRPIGKRIQRRGFRPRYAAYMIVAAWSVGVVVFGVVEWLVDRGTFDNVWLAMWWAIQTVTTVGYGDVVPGSTVGKVIASLLMLGGLALFAVVTGTITAAFVEQQRRERVSLGADPTAKKLDQMARELQALRAEVARVGHPTD
jgi:voltage-gated potassium channel